MTVSAGAPPSGTGCVECLAGGGWWVHLRRCAACGHVGCCDSSPAQHASAHWRSSAHPVVQSFEPGEDWAWDYDAQAYADLAPLAPRPAGPRTSRSPGPRARCPGAWRQQLH